MSELLYPAPGHAVIHMPHASTTIPADLRHQFLLTDAELDHELRVMTDHLTDRLFDVPGVASVRFPVSRLVLDPERFESDEQEIMAARGMGVIYTLMIEVNRGLYLDEATGQPSAGFDICREKLVSVLAALLEWQA